MKLSTAIKSDLIPRFVDSNALVSVLRLYRVDVEAYFAEHQNINHVYDLMDVAEHLGENHVASHS